MSEKLSGVGGLGCANLSIVHGDGARYEIPPSRGVLRASGVGTSESISKLDLLEIKIKIK